VNRKYSDRSKVNGINFNDKATNEKIYARYVAAYKKGVCDLIKIEKDPFTQKNIPRKYFSGGMKFKWTVSSSLSTTKNINEVELSAAGHMFKNVSQVFRNVSEAAASPIHESELLSKLKDALDKLKTPILALRYQIELQNVGAKH